MQDLSKQLKQVAIQRGADLVGIAPAKPLAEASAYQRWLNAGMQAGMDYMARNVECREDITRWYPEAKSVLVCGFSYADNRPADQAIEGRGRLARYSVLPDYHDELKKRMRLILSWLKQQAPESDGRLFVDTSPLLERIYARYSGMGWIGKNTMLIAPKLGSYFFLAGIAVNLELEFDEPVPDHCGSCRRCIEACPTEAFPEPRVLDAGRCISYFTIEHRGEIPEGFRRGIGQWVMGCDICQEVCPWNRFSLSGRVFKPVLESSLPLEDLAALDEASFRKKFGKTPVSRAKRRGLVRNALLAMGNTRDGRYRHTLEAYLEDQDPVLRDQARWSLEQLPGGRQS